MTGIPTSIVAGDTAQWTESALIWQGQSIRSDDFGMKIELRGPGAPITLDGVAAAGDWEFSLDETASATLVAGLYSWSKRVTASGIRMTVAQGQLKVTANFESITTPGYDGRTVAQKALADAEAALASFNAGGKTQSYSIAGRSKTYESSEAIMKVISYWRQRVNAEKGTSNDLYATFTRA